MQRTTNDEKLRIQSKLSCQFDELPLFTATATNEMSVVNCLNCAPTWA